MSTKLYKERKKNYPIEEEQALDHNGVLSTNWIQRIERRNKG